MRNLKGVLLLLLFGVSITQVGQAKSYRTGSIITNPNISAQCEELIRKRQQKIGHKQRLVGILDRNKGLQVNSPKNRITALNSLKAHEIRVTNEIKLAKLKITNLDEEIIRRGCSGFQISF